MLAAHLAAEAHGASFGDLADRAHLHAVEPTLQTPSVEFGHRSGETILQARFSATHDVHGIALIRRTEASVAVHAAVTQPPSTGNAVGQRCTHSL